MLDILDLRLAVETRAAELAAERRTEEELAAIELAAARINHLLELSRELDRAQTLPQALHRTDFGFHEVIARSSHSRAVTLAMAYIRGLTFLARPTQYEELAGTVEEHAVILSAIRAKDPRTAASAMRRHIDHVRASYMKLVGAQ